jgi:hypothetical protein
MDPHVLNNAKMFIDASDKQAHHIISSQEKPIQCRGNWTITLGNRVLLHDLSKPVLTPSSCQGGI